MANILLVEDDPFIVEIYANQLKKEGYKVSAAKDGIMALEKIAHEIPDLLILDINLPEINGWEVLKRLRQDEKTKELKVIVLSNNNEKDCLDNIINLKVLKYFLKVETTAEDIVNFVKETLK